MRHEQTENRQKNNFKHSQASREYIIPSSFLRGKKEHERDKQSIKHTDARRIKNCLTCPACREDIVLEIPFIYWKHSQQCKHKKEA